MSLRHEGHRPATSLPRGLSGGRDRAPVHFIGSCASTNDEVFADSYADVPTPWALATFDQTAGRGRQGRTWANRRGESLALTVVVEASVPHHLWGWYSLAAGLAVAETVGDGAHVKWPNDVVDSRGRKMAGILSQVRGTRLAIGVGVNLTGRTDTSNPLLARATTVGQVSAEWHARLGSEGACSEFAEVLAQAVAAEAESIDSGRGMIGPLHTRYAVKCITLGSEVRIDSGPSDTVSAFAESIDDRGHLIVRLMDGQRRTINAADVHLVRPPSMPRARRKD